MATDPFDALHVPLIAIRPRTEFTTALQQRMHAVLDVPIPEGEAEMTTDTSVRQSVQLALHYRDVNAALRWLDDVLGLQADWVHPTSGPVQHAGMRWGNGEFSINYQRGIYELGPGAVILAVDSDAELDVLYRRAIDAGAAMARPLGPNWDQRSRNFVVRDPEGTLWELAGPDAE